MKYERIRFQGRTVILRDATETTLLGEPVLSGIQVDRYGDEIAPSGVDERRQIIALSLITKRTPLVMDKHYGELVA